MTASLKAILTGAAPAEPALSPALSPLGRAFNVLDIATAAAAAFIFLAGLHIFMVGEPAQWIDLLFDDADYYAGVARGLLERGQSSFAPPIETNGYQPLWLALVTTAGAVFGHSPKMLVIEIYVLAWSFVFAFAWLSRLAYGVAFSLSGGPAG